MTRWIMIALTVLGLCVAYVTPSSGVLGLALLVTFIGAFGTIMSIASARIAERTRPDTTMLQPDVIAAIRARARAQAVSQAHMGEGSSQPEGGSAQGDART